jgi:hypothetical protein
MTTLKINDKQYKIHIQRTSKYKIASAIVEDKKPYRAFKKTFRLYTKDNQIIKDIELTLTNFNNPLTTM